MAKATKRWAVRVDFGYALFVDLKPYKKGSRKKGHRWVSRRGRCVGLMDPKLFEDFFHECCHSDPQTGPVEIRFEHDA